MVRLYLADGEFPLGHPGIVIGLTVFPVYQIIRHIVNEFMANDGCNLCFVVLVFLYFCCYLRCFVPLSYARGRWFQKRLMEHIVDLHILWELESEGYWS